MGRTAEDIKILQEDDLLLGPVKEAKSNTCNPQRKNRREEVHPREGSTNCGTNYKFVSICSDKLVVPEVLKKDILNSLHEGQLGGHLGEDKPKRSSRRYFTGLDSTMTSVTGAAHAQSVHLARLRPQNLELH